MEQGPKQPELNGDPARLEEVERLQHGLRVLDLFDQEEKAETSRTEFLKLTEPKTEAREEILNGPAYKGDNAKLNNAIAKSKNRYGIRHLRRLSMLELAAHIGVEAVIRGRSVVVEDKAERTRLSVEHGKWLTHFGRNRIDERAIKRQQLESQINKLAGAFSPETAAAETHDAVDPVVLGPAVNLEERAFRLTRAINYMARRSMLSGFDVATVTDRHMEPIWNRYEDGTPVVYVAARRKRDYLLDEVKRDFWVASGFPLLRQTTIMKEREIRPRSRKMWEEFSGHFEHPPQQSQRKKVRKQLSNYLSDEQISAAKVK
jgi:hypothetical protein